MLNTIRAAAFLSLFLFLVGTPSALLAKAPTAYEWLEYALGEKEIPADLAKEDGALKAASEKDARSTKRPDFLKQLREWNDGTDDNQSGVAASAAIRLGLTALRDAEEKDSETYNHYQALINRTEEITMEEILLALKTPVGDKKVAAWESWKKNPDGLGATAIKAILEKQLKPKASTDPGDVPDRDKKPGHGGSGPTRGDAAPSPFAQKLWAAMDETERKAFPGGLNEFAKLANSLHRADWDSNDDNKGRFEAARTIARHFPKSVDALKALDAAAFEKATGFKKEDEKFAVLSGLRDAQSAGSDSLYGDILDESKTNVERRIAKEEFEGRKREHQRKFADFPNMRADLVQYYGGKTDSLFDKQWDKLDAGEKVEKMKEAASGFATLLGTVSDLSAHKARGGKDADLYDRQLAIAAQLAEEIRTNKITVGDGPIEWDNIKWPGKPTGNTPVDEFKKQFVLDYLKVNRDNRRFEACVDAVNAGKSDPEFATCKKFLNDNYSGANLQDYINTKLASADDGDKLKAAKTAIATGLKRDENNNFVLDLDVQDTRAVRFTKPEDGSTLPKPTTPVRGMRLVVGKEGDEPEQVARQIVAALDRFAKTDVDADDKTTHAAFDGLGWKANPRGRLGSVGLVSGAQPLAPKDVARLYYADDTTKLVTQAAGPNPIVAKDTKLATDGKLKIADEKKPKWVPPVAEKPVVKDEAAQTPPADKKVTLATFPTEKAQDAQRITAALGNGNACKQCHVTDGKMEPFTDLDDLNQRMRDSGEPPSELLARMLRQTKLDDAQRRELAASLKAFVEAGN